MRRSLGLAFVTWAVLLALTIWLTSEKDMTAREEGLFQFIFFTVGVVISFVLGKQSVADAAQDVLSPHGRKSVRRIVNLAKGLGSLSVVIRQQRILLEEQADSNQGQVTFTQVSNTFDTLDVVIDGQLRTVADAIEDWRDVVPEEVQALEDDDKTDE